MYNRPKSAYLTYRHLPYPINIKLENNICVQVTHYGELSIHKHWQKILHTPTFQYSLLSISEFNDQHYIVTFGNNKYLKTNGKQNIVVSGTKNGTLFQVDNDLVALLSSDRLAPAALHSRSSAHELAPCTHHGQSGTYVLALDTHHGRCRAYVLTPDAPHSQSSPYVLALATHYSQSSTHHLVPATQPGQSSPQKRLSLQDFQLWYRYLAHSNHTAIE